MIKVKTGASSAEAMQFTERAKALGLTVKNGQIDPASAGNVKGGLAAIQAQAKDGVLDGEGLAKLRQNKGFVDSMLGRDLPISKKQSQGVQTTALEMKAAQGLIDQTIRKIEFTEKIDNPMLLAVNEKLAEVVGKFNKWVTKDEQLNLAQVEPKAAKALAESIDGLAASMGKYAGLLSRFRSALLEAEGTNFLQRMQINAIAENMIASIDGNRQIQGLASILARPIADVPVSPEVAQLAADMGGPSSKAPRRISEALWSLVADAPAGARFNVSVGSTDPAAARELAARLGGTASPYVVRPGGVDCIQMQGLTRDALLALAAQPSTHGIDTGVTPFIWQ